MHKALVVPAAVAALVAGVGAGSVLIRPFTNHGTTAAAAPTTVAESPRFGRPGGGAPMGDRPRFGRGVGLTSAAGAIGISPSDLEIALRAGQSIADVAVAHGVAVQKVIDAMVEANQGRLDAGVIAGAVNTPGGPMVGPSGPRRRPDPSAA